VRVAQLSFFSAESQVPSLGDLAGLLAASGQVVRAGPLVRLSAVVDAEWRAASVADEIAAAGLAATRSATGNGGWLVRTEHVATLAGLADAWTKGAIKSVPAGWLPADRQLRLWALAAGHREQGGERYTLGLDPSAPHTHAPLARALAELGLAATSSTREAVLRITGRKRLARLAYHIGEPPVGGERHWP
jgi:hypothetical protein